MKKDEISGANIAEKLKEYKRKLRVAEIAADKISDIVYDFVRPYSKLGADHVDEIHDAVCAAVMDVMSEMIPVDGAKKKRMRS